MKQNKQIIAITGLIGSGKSTVCAILRKKGEITLNCDEINAELLTEKKYIDGLQKLFPQAFVEGLLHKNVLRKIVFSSDNERLKLNEYSHKEIKKRLEEKIKEISAQKIFVEVPLLTDQMFISLFDTIWIVKAEENEQLQRIIHRDQISEEQALQILRTQQNITYSKPTEIIINTGDINELEEQIIKILKK